MISFKKVEAGISIAVAVALFIAVSAFGLAVNLGAAGEAKTYESKTVQVKAVNPAKDVKLQTVNVKDISEFTAEQFVKKMPLDTDKLVFNTFFLKPRQVLPFHKHPATDEIFYISEGKGEFTVGNESVIVNPTSAVYGPATVFHGLINSGSSDMIVVTVQAPKPVDIIYKENATVICPVCKQEIILKDNIKEGDIVVCPRCGAKFRVTKSKDGKWETKSL